MTISADYVPKDAEDFARCLKDPMWRLCSGQLYRIVNKEGQLVAFRPNRHQLKFLKDIWFRNVVLKARQLGYCLEPSTRVLKADLTWVRIDSLKPGDEVVATDEHVPGGRGAGRKMRTAIVHAAQSVRRMAYRITFDDGRQVVCTASHPWLTRKVATDVKWRSIDGTGNAVAGRIKPGTKVRWVTKPWGESTYEDGWFGGVLDGEGSMAKMNVAASINVSQRPGRVWDRLTTYVQTRGYHFRLEDDATPRKTKYGKTPVPKIVIGRMDEIFRVIGQTRPSRFIGYRFWEGRDLPGKCSGVGWATVINIEPVGEQAMVDLQTSTGTYIAEGFVSHNTTMIAILWLDHALFNAHQRCDIVAQDRDTALTILRDKIKLAYDNLPKPLKAGFSLERESAGELLFGHNSSSIRVSTSPRGGTVNRLHISEMGKIGAQYPEKAKEIITGALPTVPAAGIIVIESTAEGESGHFYEKAQEAMTVDAAIREDPKRVLQQTEYRFHFAAWWEGDEYEMSPLGIPISDADADYFASVEVETGKTLSARKRAWYVSYRRTALNDDPALMWQEFPSTPTEAFRQSEEGTYYARELTRARAEGRIRSLPVADGVPVNTFWDIGNSDGTAIWFHQKVGPEHRFVYFLEAWGEPYSYFVRQMQAKPWVWGRHFLPHDAQHKRQLGTVNSSPVEMLRQLAPGWRFDVVPRVTEVQQGIQLVRDIFSQCWFDETECKKGLIHLAQYRRQWNARGQTWTAEPKHDQHSEAADAFRQFAQGWSEPSVVAGFRHPNWRRPDARTI